MSEREALKRIYELLSGGDRPTVNHQNAFEHFTKVNDLLVEVRSIAMDALAVPAQGAVKPAWRCFHCDEVFTDPKAAANHFGVDHIGDETLCQMAKVDGGIARVIADLSEELQRYRMEDNTSYREFYALGADHRAALIKEEQKGYDRGLADARAEIPPPADAMKIVLRNQLSMMCALHQVMRGFLSRDELAQKRLSDGILATRIFGVSLDDASPLPSTGRE